MAGVRSYMKKMMPVLTNLTIGLVSIAAIIMVSIRVREYMAARKAAMPLLPTHFAAWRDLQRSGDRVVNSTANVTVVWFADYQCPFCKAASTTLERLSNEFGERLAVEFRHYPLSIHPSAHAAAIASVCADRQHRFDSMSRILFLKQESLNQLALTTLAAEAGVRDTLAFSSCMRDDSAVLVVTSDSSIGSRLRLKGTPTIFVNDLRFDGFPGDSSLAAHVRSAMKPQSK